MDPARTMVCEATAARLVTDATSKTLNLNYCSQYRPNFRPPLGNCRRRAHRIQAADNQPYSRWGTSGLATCSRMRREHRQNQCPLEPVPVHARVP